MAKEVIDGITYINGMPLDEFNKRCNEAHSGRAVELQKSIGSVNSVNKKSQKEWDLAFKDIEDPREQGLNIFIPMLYNPNYFPVSEPMFGYVTFEGYLSGILTPGTTYTIGDITFMLSSMLGTIPNSRKMLETALCRLQAWKLIQVSYDSQSTLITRTSLRFRGMVTRDDLSPWGNAETSWGPLSLYSVEGDLVATYNPEDDVLLYVLKDFTVAKVPSLRKETVYGGNSLEIINIELGTPAESVENTFSDTMSFKDALSGLKKVAKNALKSFYTK